MVQYVALRTLLRTPTHVIGPTRIYLDVSQFSARVEKLKISYCEPCFAFVRVRERHISNLARTSEVSVGRVKLVI